MKTTIFTIAFVAAILFSGCITNVVDEPVKKVSIQDASTFTGLKVHRSSDDLSVTGWTSDTISVTADLSVWAADEARAREIGEALEFSWLTGNSIAELVVTSDKSDQELATLHDLNISAPSRFTLDLETSSGDIRATNMTGDLVLSTSSGDVTASTTGHINVNTSDGDVTATCARGATVDVSSGDITLDVTSKDFDGVTIDASSGDVTLRLADDAKVTFDLETSSGDISVNYDGTSTSTADGTLRVDVNGGGKIVRIETSSGNITVKSLP